ncbi:MAG: FecR domain-containing protein [Gemmatimonadaceae bacterium]|nr:FecR domain-containing protein [Gemmatimonadaceae bacterium]
MFATASMIDATQFAALRDGKEEALHTLVTQHYTAWLDEVQRTLGTSAAAPRAVEHAVVAFWRDRESYTSAEDATTQLWALVREAAAREHGRLAMLHRFESHEGDGTHRTAVGHDLVTAAQLWERVQTAIRPRVADAAAIAAEHARQRHDAAEHLKALGTRRNPVWVIAGLAVVAAAAALVMRWDAKASARAKAARALASPEAQQLASGAGQRGSLRLADGSTVMLGSGVKLTVAPQFAKSWRAVRIDGAAQFSVAHDSPLPFDVWAGPAIIRATGTAFEVSAYPDEALTMIRVTNGSVLVTVGEAKYPLQTREALAVDAKGEVRVPTSAMLDEAFGWAEGWFVVNDRPLREVLPVVQRWYGLELHGKDDVVLARRLSARAPLGATREVISALERAGSLRFGYIGPNMVLSDAPTPRTR